MLGRQVGGSLLRLPIHSRLVLRPTAPFQSSHAADLAARVALTSALRCYATPGRPRKAVGEPSKPVKRAIKRQARSTSKDDPASKLVKARKTSRTRKSAAAPKKKGRKVLTEKQKETREAKREKDKIKELKALALQPPRSGKQFSAFQMFVQEKMKGTKARAADAMKDVAAEWKAVTPAQQEHYNHLAVQATEAAQAELKRWVESHSPEQIKTANNARTQLTKKFPTKTGKASGRYRQIHDERQPKFFVTSYILFAKNRQESGDFKNIPVPERGRLIGKEWQALSSSEKKKYKDLEIEDKSRYTSQFKDTYGYMPPSFTNGLQAASATA